MNSMNSEPVSEEARSHRPGIPVRSDTAYAQPTPDDPDGDGEKLAPLFAPQVATDYRAQWEVVQRGFVDDPQRAVGAGDELVMQVMKTLAETFAKERAALEGRLGDSDDASTETLRVALLRYKSFFERLLSV